MDAVIERPPAEYWNLVRAFPLVPIRDDGHLTEALAIAEPLFAKGDDLKDAEAAYLDVLVGIIERYENARYQFPEVSGKRMLRYLMEQRQLRPVDLAPILGGRQVVSDILHRKGRKLSLTNVRALSEFFHLPADVFIVPDSDGD